MRFPTLIWINSASQISGQFLIHGSVIVCNFVIHFLFRDPIILLLVGLFPQTDHTGTNPNKQSTPLTMMLLVQQHSARKHKQCAMSKLDFAP